MKRWVPFLIIYLLIHDVGGDRAVSYEGQSQATITALLASQGVTGDFISKSQYDAFIIANTPAPLTPAQLVALYQAIGIQQLSSDQTGLLILIRSVLLTAKDEINLLRQRDNDRSTDVAAAASLADLKTRWAARSSLPDRTPAQVKTAVQGNITSGAAD